MTLTAAINWRDCYKNFLYTLFDYSNWFGPKALWLDFCDFSSDENLQIYAYNPGDISKDTGDLSFLKTTLTNNYDGSTTSTATPPAAVAVSNIRRPSYGQSNYFRDCFTVDDTFFSDATYGITKWGFSFSVITDILALTFGDYISYFLQSINSNSDINRMFDTASSEMPVSEERLGVEEILHSQDIIDTRLHSRTKRVTDFVDDDETFDEEEIVFE